MCKVPRMSSAKGDNSSLDKPDIQYNFENSWIWKRKLRLQHTGWLQYIPPLLLGNLSMLVSQGLAYFTTTTTVTSWLMTIAKLLWAVGVVDILTIKFNVIRPPDEPLPKRLNDDTKEDTSCDMISIMHLRHSCRSFQPRKLSNKDREEILHIATIESKRTIGTSSIRFEYVASPLNVWPTVNCQEFLVAIGPATYDRMAVIDIGRSLQAVVLHATMMGLGTCWIGPGADHESILVTLVLEGRYNSETDHIVCVCAIGYKSLFIPLAIRIFNKIGYFRKPCSELFFADSSLEVPLDTTKHPWDRFAKCYEAARWSPSSYNAQPTRAVGTWDRDTDTVRFDFLSSTKSRYYAPVAVGTWLCDWETACESIGVRGKFAVLTKEERGIDTDNDLPTLPVYNISWVQTSDESKEQ